ncbi:MAG: DUF3419 family protein [Saprospirales bacterium]|nr:MAG: DUF3419 family protein [Saprospirales bacterium]
MSFSRKIFNSVHSNKLIYNCCWEDPDCDKKLLNLGSESKVLMLTSAGCNALDYLIESVDRIHCVDLNYRQNAVLDLKLALFKNGDYNMLWEFFGDGKKNNAKDIYKNKLSDFLQPESKKFWDLKIKYFDGGLFRKTFYYRGASGILAWWVSRYLKSRPSLKKKIDQLLATEDLLAQKIIFKSLEKQLFSFPLNTIMNRLSVLALAGVPKSQFELVSSNGTEKTSDYLKDCFQKTFNNNPGAKNYFYQVYYYGKYTKESCPEYLKEENFEKIRGQIEKITFSTESINDYLKKSDIPFTHFVLLDHMDWLVANQPTILEEQWNLINSRSSKHSRVLFRSAAKDQSFLPKHVFNNFSFYPGVEDVQKNDRVGMYRYTGLAIKNPN